MEARRATAALIVLLFAACGGSATRSSSPELLPDLDQAPPGAVSVVVKEGRERLVFLSAVENVGRAPLVVAGRRTTGSEMTARQLIRRADGSTAAYPVHAHLRFVVAETHRHWHLLGFERYELLSSDGKALGRDHKTGFCLGDRYDARASVRIHGEPPRAVWTQECGRGQPERTRILEGISPGFGDDYVPLLEGQYIDVTDLPAGRYLLVHRVNPEHDLREESYANNAASVLLELRRTARGRITVAVLATCPESARCP